MEGGPFGDIKKVSQSRKRGESHSAEKKIEPSASKYLQKISAYARVRTRTLWVEKQASTTRLRTRELCDLPRETREVSRGKKAPALSHNTSYRECNKAQIYRAAFGNMRNETQHQKCGNGMVESQQL